MSRRTLAWGLILGGIVAALWATGALDELLGGDDAPQPQEDNDLPWPDVSPDRLRWLMEGDLEGLRESITGRFGATP